MRMIILADDVQQQELTGGQPFTGVLFVSTFEELVRQQAADIYMDLQFENTPSRIGILRKLLPATVVINCVADTLEDTDHRFVRVNGWPTFLRGKTIEASGKDHDLTEKAFQVFGKQVEWLPDTPGLVSARVVCMIIHEAFLSFTEGVSSRQDMDTAMKLGTNYPFGPFEWAEKIGQDRLQRLATRLGYPLPGVTKV
ncbi:MAG TPA: 3-hydroxyacyl-CoA dehydrogenase family protein [Flavisolibacter sp.]